MTINEILLTAETPWLSVNGKAYKPGMFEGFIIVPSAREFTPAECIDMKTTMVNLLKDNSYTKRAHVFKFVDNIELKNTEASYQTTGMGNQSKSTQGRYGFSYTYQKGGLALHKALAAYDGNEDQCQIIFIDKKNNGLFGRKLANGNFKGFTPEMIDVPNVIFATPADATKQMVNIHLQDPDEINKYWAFVQFDCTANEDVYLDLNELMAIEMYVHTANVAGLVKLRMTAGGGAENLYTDWSTQLATASLYTITNKATGAAITLTSATATAASQTIDLQMNAADTDYTAVATGGPINIYIGTNTALAAAGLVGFGDNTITITK